jgi:hypothetical protein
MCNWQLGATAWSGSSLRPGLDVPCKQWRSEVCFFGQTSRALICEHRPSQQDASAVVRLQRRKCCRRTRRPDMDRTPIKRPVVALAALCVLIVGRPAAASSITLCTIANAQISPSGSFTQLNTTGAVDDSGCASARALNAFQASAVGTTSRGNKAIGGGGPAIRSSSRGTSQAGLDVNDGLSVFGWPREGSLTLDFEISGSLSTATSGLTTFTNTAATSVTFFVNTDTNLANVLSLNAPSQNGPGENTGPMSLPFPATWTIPVPSAHNLGNGLTQTASGALGNTFTPGFIQVGLLAPGGYVAPSAAVQAMAVPEPGSLALVVMGLASVAAGRYRRRRHC